MEESKSKKVEQVYYAYWDKPKKLEEDIGPWFSDYADYKSKNIDNASKNNDNYTENDRLSSINNIRFVSENKDLDCSIDK